MDQREQRTADNHEGCTLAILVVDAAKEGSEEDGAERQHGRNETGQVGVNMVLEDHELGGKLEEGEDAGIEHEAEHGDIPETAVEEERGEVGKLKTFFLVAGHR